ATAHAARGRELRLRPSEDDLRRDRRQGVDLPGRGPEQAGGGARRPRRVAETADARSEEGQVAEDAEGAPPGHGVAGGDTRLRRLRVAGARAGLDERAGD